MLGVSGELRAETVALGRYRIVLPLGQGGTADVYLAVADGPGGFQKLVVLKVLKKSLSSDQEFREMFLSEARLAARLHHPNIVQTNEVLEADGTPVIVMEYLDGQPLSQVIVRGKQAGFTLAMQLRILADALGGLQAAHDLTDFDGLPLGVVHRDVSPHNLFVTLEGHAKVLDFGIAKLERSLVETEVGTIKGKLRYMAPEQIAGEKLDRRADLYAAGVILWEALSGERMWKGCSEQQIKLRVLAGDLPIAEAARPDLPASLDRICRRALSLSPADRHQTALELADDLEAALSEMGGPVGRREIGATVARLFADLRAQTKSALEQTLGRSSLLSMPAVSESPIAAVKPDAATGPAATGPAAVAPGGQRRRRALVSLAVTLGIGLVVAAGIGARRAGVAPTLPPPAAQAPAPSAAVVPPPVSGNLAPKPVVDDTPASDRRAGAPISKRPRRHAAPGAVTGDNAPATARDCEHPFFVDGDGIKKFRPECM